MRNEIKVLSGNTVPFEDGEIEFFLSNREKVKIQLGVGSTVYGTFKVDDLEVNDEELYTTVITKEVQGILFTITVTPSGITLETDSGGFVSFILNEAPPRPGKPKWRYHNSQQHWKDALVMYVEPDRATSANPLNTALYEDPEYKHQIPFDVLVAAVKEADKIILCELNNNFRTEKPLYKACVSLHTGNNPIITPCDEYEFTGAGGDGGIRIRVCSTQPEENDIYIHGFGAS